jgi:hypothetical protein
LGESDAMALQGEMMIGWQAIEETFEQFKATPITTVPLNQIQCDPAMQPRDIALLPKAERAAERSDRGRQVADMQQRLADSPKLTLDPLYLARVGDVLYVVDGHTRREAYIAARRKNAPAAIVPMSREVAVMVSKVVNTTPRARALRRRMVNEAWWAVLWQLSDGGKKDPGPVARALARRFGVDKKGPTKACKWMREGWIDPETFTAAQCDPDTGRPYYSAVALAVHRRFQGTPEGSDDAGTLAFARELEKLANSYLKLATRYTGRQRWRGRAAVLDRLGQQAEELVDFIVQCDEAAGMPDSAEDF